MWDGEQLGQTMTWLRWWDADGNLLLWSAEQSEQAQQRAEREHLRAEALAAQLWELGIDPTTLT